MLTRALDVILTYLSVSDDAAAPGGAAAAAAAAATAAARGSPAATALVVAAPAGALRAPPRAPRVAAQLRACAERRSGAGEAAAVWRGGAPRAFTAADVALVTRFRAHPAAVAALRPGAAAAVLRALGAPAADAERDAAADADSAASSLPPPCAPPAERLLAPQPAPVCGIMLEPLLDARGRLRPGTAALVQADSQVCCRCACVMTWQALTWHATAAQGVLHAHLYRADALARWLAWGGARGATHPATRAAVAPERDVALLR